MLRDEGRADPLLPARSHPHSLATSADPVPRHLPASSAPVVERLDSIIQIRKGEQMPQELLVCRFPTTRPARFLTSCDHSSNIARVVACVVGRPTPTESVVAGVGSLDPVGQPIHAGGFHPNERHAAVRQPACELEPKEKRSLSREAAATALARDSRRTHLGQRHHHGAWPGDVHGAPARRSRN
jgi:hypothetical protein